MLATILLIWAGAQLDAPLWYWLIIVFEVVRWVHKNVKLKLDPDLFENE